MRRFGNGRRLLIALAATMTYSCFAEALDMEEEDLPVCWVEFPKSCSLLVLVTNRKCTVVGPPEVQYDCPDYLVGADAFYKQCRQAAAGESGHKAKHLGAQVSIVVERWKCELPGNLGECVRVGTVTVKCASVQENQGSATCSVPANP